jgi:hypothetical protein
MRVKSVVRIVNQIHIGVTFRKIVGLGAADERIYEQVGLDAGHNMVLRV